MLNAIRIVWKLSRMYYLILILCQAAFVFAQYEVPEATVEAYHPKGFSVSIPDEDGIKLFAFHGKINQEMDGREAGTFSRDILRPVNGMWTFTDRSTKLRVGDKIYYWTYVEYGDEYEKRGYPKDDQVFTVTNLIKKPPGRDKNKDTGESRPSVVTEPTTTTTTTITTTTTTTPSPPPVSTVCDPTVTVINNGQSTCKGKLIFSESFNTRIKSASWTFENKFAGLPDYEFVLYTNRPEVAFIQDKALVIKPALMDNVYGPNFVEQPLDLGTSCTGALGTLDCHMRPDAGFILPPVISAKITTKGKFSFKYGKIEIRAKLPKGDWLYPILTLNPVKDEYGPGYDSGQITIAFCPGNAVLSHDVYGGIVISGSPVGRKYGLKSISRSSPWYSSYYRYAVTWNEDGISLSVNDRIYGTISPPSGGFSTLAKALNIKNADRWKTGSLFAPFDKEMYISVGVGAGGLNFEDKTDGSKPWRNYERLSFKKFYQAQQNWSSTWDEDSRLSVTSIKVWAL